MLIAFAAVWFYLGYGAVLHEMEEGGGDRLVAAFFLDSLVTMLFLMPFVLVAVTVITLALYFGVNRRPRAPPKPPLPPPGS